MTADSPNTTQAKEEGSGAHADGADRSNGCLSLLELRDLAAKHALDTVVVAIVDMQGRLQGKRVTVPHFIDEVAHRGTEGCSYLLAVDVDMATVGGYAMSSWDLGYGDFVLRPDLATLRRLPWCAGTALCLADLEWQDGRVAAEAPRQILRHQLARLAERGWSAQAATELEFMVFCDSYDEAWRKGYRDLRPASRHNIDYSLLGSASVEPVIRRLRNDMTAAGMTVEASKGECNRGQHEINFRYKCALETADNHAIYKTGAKEIAVQEGVAITYMAKFDQAEGNSCHLHLSLTDEAGNSVFDGQHEAFDGFLAGQLACMREFTLLYAPNVNSYKRFAAGSFAPTVVAWGEDNRTCALRVVGHDEARRIENRLPGGDVNPYLALSAMIAAGLHGIDAGLELDPPAEGNAYTSDAPRVPPTLRDARDLFAASDVARTAFGDAVVGHYVNSASVELAAFDTAVTDWERIRGFERL